MNCRPASKGDGTWRIKTSDELYELIRHKNIINHKKAHRVSWFGHLQRMPEERVVKEIYIYIYKWKPILTRPIGRPENRWEDDIRNDTKEMKMNNWTSHIQDSNNWILYVERGKTFSD